MKNLLFISTIIALSLLSLNSQAQLLDPEKIHPDTEEFDNIKVQKLYSDSLVSTFMVWVKKNVAPHYHANHTEQVYVVEGCALMTLGEDTLHIKKGEWVNIPKGTVHAVIEVHGDKPIKVMSIQTPLFQGKDRVFVD